MFIKKTYQQIYITIFLLILSYSSLASGNAQLIKDIGLSRGDNGEGIVTIILPNQDIVPDIEKQTDKIIVNLPNTELPKQLNKEINGTDSKTPITKVTSFASKEQTTLHIATLADYNYSFYQQNDTLVITLWDVNKQPQNFSANYSNTDIRIILEALSDHTKLNLVATDSVQGKMTLRTKNIHCEQALDIVLKANGLAKRLEGNVLIVAPAKELSHSPRKFIDKAPPLKNPKISRQLIPIKYTDAENIAKAFAQQQAKQNKYIGQNRGSITINTRTNTIIAYQTAENFKVLNKIIKELDIPATQVILETRIVEINKDYIETIKDQLNQSKLIDLLLHKMQKTGQGEVILQSKVTTSDKEQANIAKHSKICYYPSSGCPSSSQPTFGFTITPEIINDSQLKLSIEIYMEQVKNQNKASPAKKQFERIVNNNQTIILDELDDLQYPIKNSEQSQLLITITPRIIASKSYPTR